MTLKDPSEGYFFKMLVFLCFFFFFFFFCYWPTPHPWVHKVLRVFRADLEATLTSIQKWNIKLSCIMEIQPGGRFIFGPTWVQENMPRPPTSLYFGYASFEEAFFRPVIWCLKPRRLKKKNTFILSPSCFTPPPHAARVFLSQFVTSKELSQDSRS